MLYYEIVGRMQSWTYGATYRMPPADLVIVPCCAAETTRHVPKTMTESQTVDLPTASFTYAQKQYESQRDAVLPAPAQQPP
jgi:hypothetical protein